MESHDSSETTAESDARASTSRDGLDEFNCSDPVPFDSSGKATIANSGDVNIIKIGKATSAIFSGGMHTHINNPPPPEKQPEAAIVNTREIETALLQEGLRRYYSVKEGLYQPIEGLQNTPYLLEENYVELHLHEIHRTKGCPVPGKPIQVQEVFWSGKNQDLRRTRILVLGKPGYGKSTLCKKLVQDWVKNSMCMSQFEIVLLIRLRGVISTIEDAVVQLCNKALGSRVQKEKLLEYLNRLGSRFLLILDGYDEVSETAKSSVESIIEYGDSVGESFLKSATVLMTTRTENKLEDTSEMEEMGGILFGSKQLLYARKKNVLQRNNVCRSMETIWHIDDLTDVDPTRPKNKFEERRESLDGKNVCRSFETIWQIDNLTDAEQNCLIDKYFKDDRVKARSLKKTILTTEMNLTKSPMSLHIMCYIHEQGTEVKITEEFWEQYLKLVFKRAVGRKSSLTLNDKELQVIELQLGGIFFEHLLWNKLYIEKREIQDIFLEKAPFVMSCGLLFSATSSQDSNLFETPHKTLMEHLSEKYLKAALTESEKDGNWFITASNLLKSWVDGSDLHVLPPLVKYTITTSLLSAEVEFHSSFCMQFIIEGMERTSSPLICLRLMTKNPTKEDCYYSLRFDVFERNTIKPFLFAFSPKNDSFKKLVELFDSLGNQYQFYISNECSDEFSTALDSLPNTSLTITYADLYCGHLRNRNLFQTFEQNECNVEQICSAVLSKSRGEVNCSIFHSLREDQLTELLLKEYEDDSLALLIYLRNDTHRKFRRDNKEALKRWKFDESVLHYNMVYVTRQEAMDKHGLSRKKILTYISRANELTRVRNVHAVKNCVII